MQQQNTAADLLEYLPVLKKKFVEIVGETNEMEQLLIDSAFESYEMYLAFLANNCEIPANYEQRRLKFEENSYLQMASIVLNFKKIVSFIKENRLEVDEKLLKEIFQDYRESMLHFKYQKDVYRSVKTLLNLKKVA